MTDPEFKFRDIYRVPSHRLKGYDYSSEGAYFITICTKNRENYFGDVVDGKMVLTEMGKIADKFLQEIPDHFQNVLIDAYVIMPNHIHFIVIMKTDDDCRDVALLHLYGGADKFTKQYYSDISPKKWTIWSIIRSYKSICTKTINAMQDNIFFAWQPNYHDRIIRDENEWNRIRQYIVDNPAQWENDENYQK